MKRKYFLAIVPVALFAVIPLLTTLHRSCFQGTAVEPLQEVPEESVMTMGSDDAGYVITLLFDYQCSHCRTLHQMLPKVVEMSGGDIAFRLCPTPLSTRCNPYIPLADMDPFEGSCELARTALAVWYSAPERFPEFDDWMFSGQDMTGWHPRPVAEAQAYAGELLAASSQDLTDAMNNPMISDAIALHTELLGRTSAGNAGGIPRLIFGQRWLVPKADDAESLLSDIVSQLIGKE